MAGWLVLLIVTNLLTLAGLVLLQRHHRVIATSDDTEDIFTAPRPSGVTGHSRRLITVEILNPIELVSSRGRVAGLAGSLAPGLARRLVYDQVLKTLRRELADKQVVADVKLHQLRPVPKPAPDVELEPFAAVAAGDEVDVVSPVDLDEVESDQL